MKEASQSPGSRQAWDFFGLPRPEYPSAPENLISSLAWSVTKNRKPPPVICGVKHGGLVYQRVNAAKPSKRLLLETAPRQGDAQWEAVETKLGDIFAIDPRDQSMATEILIEDLVGNVPAKAHSRAVIPFNAHTALMQDSRGMLVKDNPPNFALIVQRMFVLGGGSGEAAYYLANAFQQSRENEGWFETVTELIPPTELKDAADELLRAGVPRSKDEHPPLWLRDAQTPFRWFSDAWTNLMANDWKGAMPARRWADWATCILRTTLGTGYMFEMNFYYQLVLLLHGDPLPPAESARRVLRRDDPFFPWDTFTSVSSRDVATKIRKTCERGTACRALLQEWVERAIDPCPKLADYVNDQGLENWIRDARTWFAEGDMREKIEARRNAISASDSQAAKNIYFTIAYSLLDRSGGAMNTDLYALLKKRGRRYTIVEPGQEWFVVVSSMQARRPGGRTRVADVIKALDMLGVRTGYNTIVKELERAGMARTSHDADDAIVVLAAF